MTEANLSDRRVARPAIKAVTSPPRVPPHDPEAEASLVGAVFVRPEMAAAELLASVSAGDFYDVSLGTIVSAIEAVLATGDIPDVHRVATELRRAGLLDGLSHDGATGAAVLVTLQARGTMRSHIPQRARSVVKDSSARKVIAQAERLAEAGYAGDLDQAAAIAVEAADELGRGTGIASSWEPVDLETVLSEDPRRSAPTLLRRSDGEALLYVGRSHAFNGAPESFKSLLAQALAKERVEQGEHVVYVDFEDEAAAVVERLVALGLSATDLLERFHYVRPDAPFSAGARSQLLNVIRTHQPTVAVLDGVAEAMAQNGWNESDNGDVAAFLTALVRPLEREGCCVVVIDHLVKDKEGQGRYARGGGHKLAGLSGAAYKLEVSTPFGRGTKGTIRLSVMKDRPGWVRRVSIGSRAGDIEVCSSVDGSSITLGIRAPEVSTDPFRPTVLMEHVSRMLEAESEPVTQARVLEATRGNRDYRIAALRCLVDEGFVERTNRGQSYLHRSLMPFRQPAADPTDDVSDDQDPEPEQGAWEVL